MGSEVYQMKEGVRAEGVTEVVELNGDNVWATM